ncbi:DUF4194 domain-containing protein [Pyxidicoccus fallax]|uniref:DUF4194 domain-containing protein n=1 Tax=Pyxidicoccus fallax TaxID=394095 RepID=A0A848LRC0_9BACT|nr:DUF4194 domain-containing protein [Pyxidicoccus fallax]NMO20316.1 DUF4194 domain-containing protein [Pyxidicoccus fallax]NPC81072.1 DUF4194 domain-containing protein [Pyxidicoccus fallax]
MTPNPSRASEACDSLSLVLVALMKGVVYQEGDPTLWQGLLNLHPRVREHVAVLGLQLVLDEREGYAYLRQQPTAEGGAEVPHLVARRQLSYGVSLLLALLRKKLAEAEATAHGGRLVLRREDILELVRLFLPEGTNEARMMDRLDADLAKVVELGFLRKLRGGDEAYEVRRILKAFVDAQWLDTFQQKLADYRAHLRADLPDENGATQ